MTKCIESHKEEWRIEFGNLKSVLLKILDGYELDIQHVGSTAIPGLFAKPILNIDIIINNKGYLNEITLKLENAGYKSRGEQGIVGRFAFRQTTASTPQADKPREWQVHHLYVCFSDSLALKNHLLFREILLTNKKLAKDYSQLKINLTKENNMTREYYTKKKSAFIIAVLTSGGLDENELNEITKANR